MCYSQCELSSAGISLELWVNVLQQEVYRNKNSLHTVEINETFELLLL